MHFSDFRVALFRSVRKFNLRDVVKYGAVDKLISRAARDKFWGFDDKHVWLLGKHAAETGTLPSEFFDEQGIGTYLVSGMGGAAVIGPVGSPAEG